MKLWQRSSSWRHRVARGGNFRRCSARAGRRSTGGSPCGAGTGSGRNCTASSSTNSEHEESSTGRAVRSIPSACGLQKAAAGRAESDRPRQVRIEDPPDHRQERAATIPGHLRREHARHSQGLEPLVRGIPPIRSRRGPRRRRPAKLHAERLRLRPPAQMAPQARNSPSHRSQRRRLLQRLGRHRWVVERTISWLAGCRRLHRRYERKAEHFLAFVGIAAALISYRRLDR